MFFPRFALALGGSNPLNLGLNDDLVSYWKMDESSAGAAPVTRIDSITANGNNLTDNNTVPSAAGKISNCASLDAANLEFLSRASNASLQAGDISFTFAAWVQSSTFTIGETVLGKGPVAGNGPYKLFTVALTPRLNFSVFDGSSVGSVTANTFGDMSINTWYFVVGWHDSVANQLGISINATTADTQAWTTGTNVETNGFSIGKFGEATEYWTGLIDEVGFWKRVLSAAEITSLYNAGAGRTYPF